MKKLPKKNELQVLKNVVDNMHVSINIFDVFGDRIFANPYYYFVTGKKQGSKLSTRFNPEGEAKKKDNILDLKIREALEDGRISELHNYLYQPKYKKTRYYFDILIGPLKNNSGKIIGAYSMAKDVTTRFIARKKLINLNNELERKVEERTRKLDNLNKKLNRAADDKNLLLSQVAHEIKTILTIVKGNMDIIRSTEEFKMPLSLECDKEIHMEIERLNKIVSDLVFITKSEVYSNLFKFEPIDLIPIIKNIAKEHKVIAKQNNFKIHFSSAGAKSMKLNADKMKIQTLVSNMIENAVKYGKRDGKLDIGAHRKNGQVFVSFKDDGRGIDGEHIDYIFDPFFQVKKTNNSKMHRGFGLGLAICKKIVSAHKGTIDVKSELGIGTEFLVALPIK